MNNYSVGLFECFQMVDMAQRLGASLQVGESVVGQMQQQKPQQRPLQSDNDSSSVIEKTDS